MSYSRPQTVASTIGFEQAKWNQQYYPEECPPDWRIAYFINDFRAVYLAADMWVHNARFTEEIADEIDADFELVIEWPASITDETDNLLSQLSLLKNNIASIICTVHEPHDQALHDTLETLSQHYPISLYSSIVKDSGLIALAKQYQASVVWYPELNPAPLYSHGYQVVVLPCYELRTINTTLEKLSKLLKRGIRIGLFFEPAPQSPERAMQTRELIELLDMA